MHIERVQKDDNPGVQQGCRGSMRQEWAMVKETPVGKDGRQTLELALANL